MFLLYIYFPEKLIINLINNVKVSQNSLGFYTKFVTSLESSYFVYIKYLW
jgi:hypothetical protein